MLRVLIFAVCIVLHPVHVSILSIEYSVEEKAFIGFLKVYYDDFLLDLKGSGERNAQEMVPVLTEKTKEIVGKYLTSRLNLYTGEKGLNPVITGMILNDNELRLDLVFKSNKKQKNIRIYNAILSDVYSDQSNLVILRFGKYEEGVRLTPEKREYIFKIK